MSSLIVERSLMNCHAYGLDSIVLRGAPGMVRIFLARPEHDLYRNYGGEPLGLGIHAHHCDISLIPLFGTILNIGALEGSGEWMLTPWAYGSGVNGIGSFSRLGPSRPFQKKKTELTHPLHLAAKDQHTVFVPMNETAAWMVCEGREDNSYLSVTYSDADLSTFDFSGLYQPMTEERLAEDLHILNSSGVSLGHVK
jgi:hypothetical protein